VYEQVYYRIEKRQGCEGGPNSGNSGIGGNLTEFRELEGTDAANSGNRRRNQFRNVQHRGIGCILDIDDISQTRKFD